MSKDAVILVNLGSPKSPSPKDVGRFLRAFLSDRRVVEANPLFWRPLLYTVVVPLRKKRSAHAYQSIWWEQGSPIRVISERQRAALQSGLDSEYGSVAPKVYSAETYGEPDVRQCLGEISAKHSGQIIVLPLYPQYSATTTAAIMDQVAAYLQSHRALPNITLIAHYYERPEYIEALAESVTHHWQENGATEKLLISFHGIPRQYVEAGDPYQQQCESTARRLVARLQLADDQWAISYQSRFGPKEWLQPYTDSVLQAWAGSGVKSVTVISPAFAADCLETLEELAMESKKVFIENGGTAYQLVPCLNDNAAHIRLFKNIVADKLSLNRG